MGTVRFINIGYGNVVSSEKIVAIVLPDAAPVKRLVQDARANGNIIDATCGRIDMRMYSNVCMYILQGLPMKEVGFKNHCDKSTVSRDVTRFFATCSWAFEDITKDTG